MGLGTVRLDYLADLHGCQLPDHPGTQEKTDQKGAQSPVNRSERDIPENIEKG
jgi:hypothetical protein